jgi:prepilin-type N-terminal cleavage/methylation domain-containing protein
LGGVNPARSNAFTLAEVLITLGVIGVVAALTLPTVISNYNKKVVETRLAKFYSSFNQAIKMSEADNESCKYWSYGDINNHRDLATIESWWNKYMNDYFPSVSTSTTLKNTTVNGKYTIHIKDGSVLAFEALPGSYAWFIYYPQAKLKNSKNGRDKFGFYLFPQKSCSLRYYNTYTSREEIITKCLSDYNGTSHALGDTCVRLIMDNGWKIPDDYPIKF